LKEPQLAALFNRYLNNQCSSAEVKLLLQHFNSENEALLRNLIQEEIAKEDATGFQPELQAQANEVWQQIKQKINEEKGIVKPLVSPVNEKRSVSLWVRIAAAACIILALGMSTYFIWNDKNQLTSTTSKPDLVSIEKDTLAPAIDKAILTLSDGRTINLDNSQSGLLATEGATKIHKASDGKVVYESTDITPTTEITYNVLSTPRGGKYDLMLSDGTKVWLNAASSIRYPSVFSGSSREVEITGEAYFEVKHDDAKPFRVKAAGQLIEDIGTAFNVNAYDDEPELKTTLVEGIIKVTVKDKAAILKPGQQAVTNLNQPLHIKSNVDVDEAMAWHKGLFHFQDADIQTMMRQLARWYDVDISYEGPVPQRRFSGKIYRNISALKVADILSYKQIHFRIEGKRIIVMP